MNDMKTLYVSDLDGTLLRSDEKTSAFTNDTINELTQKGLHFSYATARSYHTARKATAGLNAQIPLIVYNGAMVVDNVTGKRMLCNFFDAKEIKEVLDDLTKAGVYPIVYAFVEDIEKFSYVQALNTKEQQEFLDTRKNDVRDNPVEQASDLYKGEIFYLTCIGDYEKLAPFYEKYKDIYHCVFQEDIYLHSQWLEIMPKDASKANAIRQLKEFLGCERVVAFGDGINDVDMFLLADEAYAVENACDELKAYATGVIGSNNEDAVAKFLLNRLSGEKKK